MKVSRLPCWTLHLQPEQTIKMINVFPQHLGAYRLRLARPRVYGANAWRWRGAMLRSNSAVNLLHLGFVACNNDAHGLQAAGQYHLSGAMPAGCARPNDPAQGCPIN